MKMQEVRDIAKKMKLKTANMKKVDIIKTIQRAEGNKDCFGNGADNCGQMRCLWYGDCLSFSG